MRIAMVTEHASPLAVLGGVDAGGQNVHVAALATALARLGDDVVVHTRRDDPQLARRVQLSPGVEVDHVDAGPPTEVPKDELLQYMAAFADDLREQWTADPPDVVHAHFWMSGLAALDAGEDLGIPVVHTFHALGTVKRRHQGDRDTSPPSRIALETRIARSVDRVVATCSDEVFELLRMGVDRRRVTVVPCGVDLKQFGARLAAGGATAPAGDGHTEPHRFVAACRLVERKGLADAMTALADVPGAELHVAGGPEASALDADPEAQRLRALAERLGVADRLVLRGRVGRDDDAPAAALRRRRRVRAVVRAVRDRAAGGDGLRRAGRRDRRRRPERLRRPRRDRRPRPAARPDCARPGDAAAPARPGATRGVRRAGPNGRVCGTASTASRARPATSTSRSRERGAPEAGADERDPLRARTARGPHAPRRADAAPLAALYARDRPARALGARARPRVDRGWALARGRQRRLGLPGAAPDGRARRALPRRSRRRTPRSPCAPRRRR